MSERASWGETAAGDGGDRNPAGAAGPEVVAGPAALPPLFALLALFFVSGAAALVYEVLWLKELGRLFGVTAHAAATTLAVFFLGLAGGSLAWGRRAARTRHPLRTYAWLELAIAASAVLYFGLHDLYRWLYPDLFAVAGDRPALFLAIKFLLAVGILFPPAFFMGGTLPVMGEFLVRRASELGRTATVLYTVNTLGAAVGALAAGFYLPRALGFRGSYLTAMALNVIVALIALAWSRGEWRRRLEEEAAEATARPAELAVRPGLVWLIAAASGFLTLGLEVLWTRMFAQVLQNSVYTFAAILTIFLAALGVGSALSHLLARTLWSPRGVLFALLCASGLAVAATPTVFQRLNDGLGLLGGGLGWTGYVVAVFSGAAAVLLVPGILIGSVFPYLMKVSEPTMTSAGRTIGQLASTNTLAAIFGSLAAGFVLLDWLGLWASLRLVAAAYLLVALAVVPAGRRARIAALLPVAGLALLFATFRPGDLVNVSLDGAEEEVVELTEGAHGTVAVIRRGDDLRLKVNNHYLLGTAMSTPNQRLQAWLALALHPRPRSVFFLGMGTGITAGAALDHPVERVVVTELNAQVVEASRAHFGPYLNGLFEDPRVRVLATDGRAYLAGTSERFDVVIGDIFLTYRAGVGSLYTREHFATVKSRLEPGGIFVQWLPMFDLSPREFGIVARTMLEVFPQITLWRRSFSPRYPVFALVAGDPEPLDADALRAGFRRLVEQGDVAAELWFENIPLAAYAGNPSVPPDRYRDLPVSTDDYPALEYLAPITERQNRGARAAPTLCWLPLVELCQRLIEDTPPADDPYLERLDGQERKQVLAGLAYQQYEVNRRAGRREAAEAALARYRSLVAAALAPAEPPREGRVAGAVAAPAPSGE